MASPQTENGHIRIATELFEAILRYPFTHRQQTVLLAMIREIYGWRETEKTVSAGTVQRLTGLKRYNASRAMLELVKMGVLERQQGKGQGYRYRIVKDFEQWRASAEIALATSAKTASATSAKLAPDQCQNGTRTSAKLATDHRKTDNSTDRSQIRAREKERRKEKFMNDLVERFGQVAVDDAWSKVPGHCMQPLPYIRAILENQQSEQSNGAYTTVSAHDVASDGGPLREPMDLYTWFHMESKH